MSTATATTSAQIIHHTAAFISETLSQTDLRNRIFSTFRHKIPSWDQITRKTLNLAVETLENVISTTNNAARSSSLRLLEKLLLSYPGSPFSSFLLSLTHSLSHRPMDAALRLLDVFNADPSLARTEIAPFLFEELFLVHFLPLLQWFNDQRSTILSSLSPNDDTRSKCNDSVVSCGRLLSNMSSDQASELKELERQYGEVLDENCRVFARYFREILESKDGNQLIDPPSLVLVRIEEESRFRYAEHENIEADETELKNGRYNPIWLGDEKSVELPGSTTKSLSKFPSLYPERVSPEVLTSQASSEKLKSSPRKISESDVESSSDDNVSNPSSSSSSSQSEAEMEQSSPKREQNRKMASSNHRQDPPLGQQASISAESSRILDTLTADIDKPPGGGTGKHTPPKDFVCPITSHIFDDPVTLETGQTYERNAIREWLDRGNTTCPITRQMLHSTLLPKTNYVLKRLIASWLEQNPGSVLQSDNSHKESDPIFNSVMCSTSPNSVITQASIDGTVSELRLAITNLCMSEILEESEMAVHRIEHFWQEASLEVQIQTLLSKPPVINGLVEVLFNSVDPEVLKKTVFLLSELGSRDKGVIQTLTQVDSDVECVVALFKKGLYDAVVLIYLLRPSTVSLLEMDMVDSLLTVFGREDNALHNMCIMPKTASVLLLGQMLRNSDEGSVSEICRRVISEQVVESIVSSLEAEWAEERIAATSILLRCMQEDGKCRNIIADKAELAPVLGSFMGANDGERFEIVHFLSELVKSSRRTFNEQVLHIIRDEGTFSMMHTLLIYLPKALQDQRVIVASLLLQLDLLAEPRKMSIYREEAIDTLISCLKDSDFPAVQIAAAEMILALQGTFSSSGKPLARASLLKRAGLEKNYRSVTRKEQLSNMSGELQETSEEEKAAGDWERRMAFVLVSHEFGLLLEALAEGLKSRYTELCSACFVSATWLVHMLTVLPDTGIRGAARVCLLKFFVSIFKSTKNTEDKALCVLALSSFIHDPEGLHDLTSHMKDILKGLRELRKYSVVAFDMLKILSEGQDSSADFWNHKELFQEDCSLNGEVLSLVCFKDKIISGHSDGTIKVWAGKSNVYLKQETREHVKAVTSLSILHLGERLYSGSIDRTVRVWTIGREVINCIQVIDVKDQVNNLVVANSIACFIPQGAGVKVHSWSGGSKLLNSNKYAKCLALSQGKLYCGCHDNSIQEIDLATGTLGTIQNGSRKLLGKSHPVHALQVHEGRIYSASSPLHGIPVKIRSASNYSMVGSLPSTLEVRAMAISSELIYLGCKGGLVEVWCSKKHHKIDTLQGGTSSKVNCMALDSNEEVLVIGTSDGRLLAWGLS